MGKKYVIGLENIRRVFGKLPAAAMVEIDKALVTSANEIADIAEVLVPEDLGDLKNSIGVERPRAQSVVRFVVGGFGGRRGGAKSASVYVVAGVDRETAQSAFRQEFGRASSGDHPGHPAQPFMVPAYWAGERRARSRIKRAVNKAAKITARARYGRR